MANPYQATQMYGGGYNGYTNAPNPPQGYANDQMSQPYGTQNQSSMPRLGGNASGQKSFPTLPGMLVNTPDDILAKDVPMDGSISLFLMSDLSAILAKQWNSKGSIDTVQFVRAQNNEQASDDVLSQIMERLDRIESAVKKKYSGPRKPYYKNHEEKGESQNV